MKERRHVCSECGKLARESQLVLKSDAACVRHWFHSVCWEKVCAWLSGGSGDRESRR